MQLPTTLLPTRNSKRKQYSSDRRRIDPNAIFFLIWKEKGGTFVKRASDSAKKKERKMLESKIIPSKAGAEKREEHPSSSLRLRAQKNDWQRKAETAPQKPSRHRETDDRGHQRNTGGF